MNRNKGAEPICKECTVFHRASMEWEAGKGQCHWCRNHRLIANNFIQVVLSESEAVSNMKTIKCLRDIVEALKKIIAS